MLSRILIILFSYVLFPLRVLQSLLDTALRFVETMVFVLIFTILDDSLDRMNQTSQKHQSGAGEFILSLLLASVFATFITIVFLDYEYTSGFDREDFFLMVFILIFTLPFYYIGFGLLKLSLYLSAFVFSLVMTAIRLVIYMPDSNFLGLLRLFLSVFLTFILYTGVLLLNDVFGLSGPFNSDTTLLYGIGIAVFFLSALLVIMKGHGFKTHSLGSFKEVESENLTGLRRSISLYLILTQKGLPLYIGRGLEFKSKTLVGSKPSQMQASKTYKKQLPTSGALCLRLNAQSMSVHVLEMGGTLHALNPFKKSEADHFPSPLIALNEETGKVSVVLNIIGFILAAAGLTGVLFISNIPTWFATFLVFFLIGSMVYGLYFYVIQSRAAKN